MARAQAEPAQQAIDVVALLSPRLRELGEHVAELIQRRPTIKEYQLDDGTPCCPSIRLSADQAAAALPGLEQHKTVTWRVDGRDTEHLMLCLARDAFLRHVQRDGLASLLHAAEAARPGCRLHLLTYNAMGEEAARRVAADLAVWCPDVAFHCAESIHAAAEYVYRVTRAVAEVAYKQTTARSYVAVELQSNDAQKKKVQLERLLERFAVPRDGSKAALMHMLTAVGASAAEAYAVGAKFSSLQGLLEAVERDGTNATQDAVALLPLPASSSLVGQAAAEKVVRLAALGGWCVMQEAALALPRLPLWFKRL